MRLLRQLLPSFAVVVASFAILAAPTFADETAERKAALEREFENTMSGATLVGFFTMDGASADSPLREERYTIRKVTPLGNDRWRFDARVQYGNLDVTVPIPLSVLWAGDTPVITLTDMTIPGLGTYTARVLVYRGAYAGTWSGSNYGGQMFGRVERTPAGSDEAPDAEGNRAEDGTDESGDSDADGSAAAEIQRSDAPVYDEYEQARRDGQWPAFRGVAADGIGHGSVTPRTWDLDAGENIRWRIPIPGLCHSAPIIWDDQIFVTTAVRTDGEESSLKVGLYGSIMPVTDEGPHRFDLYCLDRDSGETLWKRTMFEGEPAIQRHPKGSHAASTPVTDGKRVVAFLGTEGLHCFAMDGTPKWSKDFGRLDSGFFMVPNAQWGFASSPILYQDRVLVQVDVQGQSFLAALDAETGEELWRTNREEVPTWCTPTIYHHGGDLRIAANGWKHVGGYDFETGREIWKLTGGGDIPVPTPVLHDDLLYFTSAHGREAPIYGIYTGATGALDRDPDIEDALAFHLKRRGNYMQTPLAYGGYLFCCSDRGVLACYDARTGREHFRERIYTPPAEPEGGDDATPGLPTGYTASIVAAGGLLYATSEEGDVFVLRLAPEMELLEINSLGEPCMATPAIANDTIFFRTRSHLVAVGSSE